MPVTTPWVKGKRDDQQPPAKRPQPEKPKSNYSWQPNEHVARPARLPSMPTRTRFEQTSSVDIDPDDKWKPIRHDSLIPHTPLNDHHVERYEAFIYNPMLTKPEAVAVHDYTTTIQQLIYLSTTYLPYDDYPLVRDGSYADENNHQHKCHWSLLDLAETQMPIHWPIPWSELTDRPDFANTTHSYHIGPLLSAHDFKPVKTELRISICTTDMSHDYCIHTCQHNNAECEICTTRAAAYATLLPTIINFLRGFIHIMVYANGYNGFDIWAYDELERKLQHSQAYMTILPFQLTPQGLFSSAKRLDESDASLQLVKRAISTQLEITQERLKSHTGKPQSLRIPIPDAQPDDEHITFLPQWIQQYALLFIAPINNITINTSTQVPYTTCQQTGFTILPIPYPIDWSREDAQRSPIKYDLLSPRQLETSESLTAELTYIINTINRSSPDDIKEARIAELQHINAQRRHEQRQQPAQHQLTEYGIVRRASGQAITPFTTIPMPVLQCLNSLNTVQRQHNREHQTVTTSLPPRGDPQGIRYSFVLTPHWCHILGKNHRSNNTYIEYNVKTGQCTFTCPHDCHKRRPV